MRRPALRPLAALAFVIGTQPALAQSADDAPPRTEALVATITSPAPDKVAVAVYREPDRDPDRAIGRSWLGGYALVTETRTIAIPAGRAVLRFEGVAGGMLPESAIVTGLPAGVTEKNLDADLLSPRTLYDRSFARPVTLRRAHPKTGKVEEEPAIIRSGPDGAAIVQTRDGFQAVNCDFPDESLVYDRVPARLSARPTLSVETHSDTAATATVTLSYLAWGFDWQANYVVAMQPDARHADLTAWVTLASSDATSFVDAQMAVVAGKVNREGGRPYRDWDPQPISFRCFYRPVPEPMDALPAPPPPPPAPMAPAPPMAEIVVTGQRMRAPVTMQQEELGDLKFYRMPVPTTVAANAQKQVALLEKPAVPVAIVHGEDVWAADPGETDLRLILRFRNRREDGLGVPLPAGPVAVFEPASATRLLSGRGSLDDKAVGEDVEVKLHASHQVHATVDALSKPAPRGTFKLTLTNANRWPVQAEIGLALQDGTALRRPNHTLGARNGRPLWTVTVPANGTATLRYRIVKPNK